jgi:TPR repeat protein
MKRLSLLFIILLCSSVAYADKNYDALVLSNQANIDYGYKDYKEAFAKYTKSCNMKLPNSWDACYGLGGMYEKGISTKKDLNKAVSLYKTACYAKEEPVSNACTALAQIYEKGKGEIAKNTELAIELYTRVCEEFSDGKVCNNLGAVYIEQDNISKAMELFERACELDSSVGCTNLGNTILGDIDLPTMTINPKYKKSILSNPLNVEKIQKAQEAFEQAKFNLDASTKLLEIKKILE